MCIHPFTIIISKESETRNYGIQKASNSCVAGLIHVHFSSALIIFTSAALNCIMKFSATLAKSSMHR